MLLAVMMMDIVLRLDHNMVKRKQYYQQILQ